MANANDGRAGDVHYWKVWHEREPVKSYEKLDVCFCSEFGMQSYASAELAATFCPPESLNVFSPVMENHQKNGGGNATMLHYMNQRFLSRQQLPVAGLRVAAQPGLVHEGRRRALPFPDAA